MNQFLKVATFLFCGLCSATSGATFSNYNSILIGDLVAGMGGAGTSIVGDVAASPFYNPATLGELEASAFSAAVGIHKKLDTVYGKDEDFTKASLRVSEGYFHSLPSSVGSAIKIKDWVFALSIIVPDYDNFKGDLYNKNNNVTTLSYVDQSLWAGGSVGKKISETESVGVTAYYTARNFNRSVSDRSFPNATQATLFSSETTKTDNSLLVIFGYFRHLNEQWAMGLSARPRSLKIAGKSSVFESTTQVDTGTNSLTQQTVNEPDRGSGTFIPAKMGLGLSYNPNPSWLFSSDATFYEELSYEDTDRQSSSSMIRYKPIWNIQLGGEHRLLPWLKLRAGVYTDFSSHPDPEATSRLQEDHVDMYGFSANFVFIAGNKIAYTFGGYYTGGKGISRQRINQQYDTVSKAQNIFTMLLGTAFYF